MYIDFEPYLCVFLHTCTHVFTAIHACTIIRKLQYVGPVLLLRYVYIYLTDEM